MDDTLTTVERIYRLAHQKRNIIIGCQNDLSVLLEEIQQPETTAARKRAILLHAKGLQQKANVAAAVLTILEGLTNGSK